MKEFLAERSISVESDIELASVLTTRNVNVPCGGSSMNLKNATDLIESLRLLVRVHGSEEADEEIESGLKLGMKRFATVSTCGMLWESIHPSGMSA